MKKNPEKYVVQRLQRESVIQYESIYHAKKNSGVRIYTDSYDISETRYKNWHEAEYSELLLFRFKKGISFKNAEKIIGAAGYAMAKITAVIENISRIELHYNSGIWCGGSTSQFNRPLSSAVMRRGPATFMLGSRMHAAGIGKSELVAAVR